MTRKRTVVVASAVSAVLLSASAAFAFSSGLFGARRAEEVGTFQAIEQRLNPGIRATSTTTSGDPESTPAPATSPGIVDNNAPPAGSSSVTVAPTTLEPQTPAENTTAAPREPSTDEASTTSTSTSTPTAHDHSVDDGHRSDD